jgi:hypothetical protein
MFPRCNYPLENILAGVGLMREPPPLIYYETKWAVVVVSLAIGAETGDFKEHAEEGEDAGGLSRHVVLFQRGA